jgi:hypothetical protein
MGIGKINKAVGFWKAESGIFRLCPKPQSLVKRKWHETDLAFILGYLRGGHNALKWEPQPGIILINAYGGWSTCRFNCEEGLFNGSEEYTDGEWIWPEGLAHYVERHNVVLPDEFVETMRRNSWKVPAEVILTIQRKKDFEFWLSWSANYVGS